MVLPHACCLNIAALSIIRNCCCTVYLELLVFVLDGRQAMLDSSFFQSI